MVSIKNRKAFFVTSALRFEKIRLLFLFSLRYKLQKNYNKFLCFVNLFSHVGVDIKKYHMVDY